MCVIAASPAGIRQPTTKELRDMWVANPDGAGYMFARAGKVHIKKGFMRWPDFLYSVSKNCFTEDDSVVYHFRIATQGGVNPEMTHPFPLTDDFRRFSDLRSTCSIGVAHNGIIRLTTSKTETRYSDTAIFIARYMSRLIRKRSDVDDTYILRAISELAQSKFCILTGDGEITTIGVFFDDDGLMLSNKNHLLTNDWFRIPVSGSVPGFMKGGD